MEIIFNFFNEKYDPMTMPVIKKYIFKLSEGNALIDEICKQMKIAGHRQPLIEEDK